MADGEAGRAKGASTLRSAAAGGRVRLVREGPLTLDLAGAAWATRVRVAGDGARFAGHEARARRLRMQVQGARAFALGAGASVTPSVTLGLRLDGGDGHTGSSMDLGGGAKEWRVGGALRLAPASGRGLSLRLAPSYGAAGGGLAHGVAPTARVDTEVGYGMGAFAGVLTPYGGLGLSGGSGRDLRLGARFLRGSAFEMALEGERRAGRGERARHGLMLRGRMRW